MFRIALCDDNPEDLEIYKKIIYEISSELVAEPEVLTFQTQESLLFAIEDVKDLVDTMFLDIRMPGVDGIELVELLRKAGYKNDVVFLTNSEDDMLRAFDAGALNYLLKGQIREPRTSFVIRQAVQAAMKKQSMKLLLTGGGETRTISVLDVRYFEVKDHLIVVHYADTTFTIISSMGRIESRLEGQGFVRIHRAYLVSCRYISSFSRNEAVLTTGERLPVSRKQHPSLRRIMAEIGKV